MHRHSPKRERRPGGFATLAVAALATVTAIGCGEPADDSSTDGGVRTRDPAVAFAPLVLLAPGERLRPMAARWFLERSVLRFADGRGCSDREIAVGRTLPERQTPRTDWIYPIGLGDKGMAYYRDPHDARCRTDYRRRAYADQLTRPHDPGPARHDGLAPGDGFYLDLVDAARSGPRGGAEAPVYHEQANEGDGVARLTYWMLFGMHAPPGRPAEAHEGDWERIDVLLRVEGDSRYTPTAVRLTDGRRSREVDWAEISRSGSRPIVASERGSHTMTVGPSSTDCDACTPWRTWRHLASARRQLWFGFGGAWGEPGPTDATTGPLGPHGFWPDHADGRP